MKASKIYLIGFIFIGSFVSYGQLPNDLKLYNEYVNQAELNIADTQYERAIFNYHQAFEKKQHPFLVDIYNQAICAALLNQKTLTEKNIKQLITFGYVLDSLICKNEFKTVLDSIFVDELIELDKSFDVGLRQKYDSLLTADQNFRNEDPYYEKNLDTLQQIDSSIRHFMRDLIELHGFPSEYLIGVYPNFDYSPFKIIVIHSQTGSHTQDSINFSNIIFKSVNEGSLDVRVAQQLIAGSTGNDLYGFHLMGAVRHGFQNKENHLDETEISEWGFIQIELDKEKEIDARRKEIGLSSLSDSRRKAIFSKKKQCEFFNFQWF